MLVYVHAFALTHDQVAAMQYLSLQDLLATNYVRYRKMVIVQDMQESVTHVKRRIRPLAGAFGGDGDA